MNAPVVILAVEDERDVVATIATPSRHQVLSFCLYDLAMSGGVALSDRYGCWTATAERRASPTTRRGMESVRRIAIDIMQSRARCLDAACCAAVARIEQVAEHATGDEAHSALAEISDLIASALVGVPT